MMRCHPPMLSLLALLPSGCYQDLIDRGAGLVSITEGEYDTYGSSSTGETPTAGDSLDVQTATGDADSEPDTAGSGHPANTPPTIDLFEVKPEHLSEAGPAELQLVVSADVSKVQLFLDGVELGGELTPGSFPRDWHAASSADNGMKREFKVIVEDAEGLTAEAFDHLSVQLPASGVTKCHFEDLQKGAVSSSITAVKYTRDAIVAVGVRDTGTGLRLTLWLLDPNHCETVLPGWPKTIASWTAQDELTTQVSIGVAVDLDTHGNIIVAGNILGPAGKPRSYVALLNPAGSRLWEQTGQPGDEVTSVAAATGQYADRFFVGGARHTSNLPVRTDAAIWIYQGNGDSVFVSPPEILAAPFTPDDGPDEFNSWSESIRALVIQPGTGNALAVGEREFSMDDQNAYNRAFTVQVHPLGGIVGTPWTSWAPLFLHDAIRSVALCGDDILAGGWTRDVAPDAKPQPMMFWLEEDGTANKHRHEPELAATVVNGIACDRAGKIVSAATRDSVARDAQVFAVPDQYAPRTTYESGAQGDDGAGAAACDWRGFCGWGGYRSQNGKPYAVFRVHHP